MAPWPEPDTEPKAPDKDKPCENQSPNPAGTAGVKSEDDAVEASASCASKPVEEVSSLDDRGLQALLDEAIAYKNPKDREKKSALFKELLAKAEADEREHSGGQRGLSGIGNSSGRYRRGPVRKGDVSERNSRGGSLQNLVHALNSDFDLHSAPSSRKRGGRRNPQPQVSVSARQREGGSLPCNVNADFYGAAALLRSQDDVTTSTTVKRRDHTTPIDDVVTGNKYSYKLGSDTGAKPVEDLSGNRASHSGKKVSDSLDDIEAAAPRGSGSKRREFKKLGHSSDAIFPESISDDICSMEDLRKEAENNRLIDFKNEKENSTDLCASDFGYLSRHNNVDGNLSDHTVIEVESHLLSNGPTMLGVGLNGSVRTGWMKSDSCRDDDLEGTEMTSMERKSEIPKYSSSRLSDHEVDQPIRTEVFSNKSPKSNGEHMESQKPFSPFGKANFAEGDSMRSTLDSLGEAARAKPLLYQVSSYDNNMRVMRWDTARPGFFRDTEKSFDENGNALHQGSGSERKFKTRKNKTDNNNYVLSEKIPGYRGDIKDINELLHFIESSNCQDIKSVSGKNNRNSNGPVNLKESKQRNNSSNGKRSEAGGSKVKSDKRKSSEKQTLTKSNSLEEISCTKLSDLTSAESATSVKGAVDKPSYTDVNAPTRESRQSISGGGLLGSERVRGSGSANRMQQKPRESSGSLRNSPPPSESLDIQSSSSSQGDVLFGDPSEFHLVIKKQRKKKSGRSSSIGRNERSQHNAQSNSYHREGQSRRSAAVDDNEGNILYQYRTAPYRSESPDHSQHQRRKSTSSMPPSDKSADSSDLDSVHSLPISSTTPRPILDKTSTSSGSTPQASYADIARMASAMSPPQGQVGPLASPPSLLVANSPEASSQGLVGGKWPSVGQSRPLPTPLWTANVTLHTATPLPASHEEGEQCFAAPVPPMSSSTISSSTKRDAMTNTVSHPESESTDCSSVGNLLSDTSYPPLCEVGKAPQTVTQCVQTFISQASQASRTSPAISPGVTMANCVDVEDSAKRAASPAAFDSVRDSSRTNALDRPAVIILDEAETEIPVNGDPELTFGFEINEMLLSGACTVSSDEEAEVQIQLSAPIKPPPVLDSVANMNLDKIVAFVGKAWEEVMNELPEEEGATGRVQFYNGQ